MQSFNSDYKAQVAIIGHAIFAGGQITHFVRPGIDDIAALFADWKSGAGIFTRQTPEGRRQVTAIALFRQAPQSDQGRVAELLQADFLQDPTTQMISQMAEFTLSTLQFDSRSVPIPLVQRIAENIYQQLYHQFHDGANN